MKKKQEQWAWDSELLRNRVLKSLGIADTKANHHKSLIGVLADSDELLEHLPFLISDVVLITDKAPIMAELLSRPKNSIVWNTISQSNRIYMFCDPNRPVDNCVIFISSEKWWTTSPPFNHERKTITTQIETYNRQLNLSAFAWII